MPCNGVVLVDPKLSEVDTAYCDDEVHLPPLPTHDVLGLALGAWWRDRPSHLMAAPPLPSLPPKVLDFVLRMGEGCPRQVVDFMRALRTSEPFSLFGSGST